MADSIQLLSDEEIQRFIVDGCLTVQADYPPSFHAGIRDQIEAVFAKEGNPGNNILPRVPQLGRVFEHPNVQGALTSLLGPDYILNPHRHCHLNPPGRRGQQWHKDCYVYDHNLRHPRFYWVLAFYFPQDTTEDMGPSGVLPGMQMYKTISDVDPEKTQEEARAFCGPAGTVALVHFDSWHRATENVSTKNRYMLKFQFARTREPEQPTWDHQRRAWSLGMEDRHPALSRDVWHWLCGKPQKKQQPPEGDLKNLLSVLKRGSEGERLDAAYGLAEFGAPAVPELVAAMREEALATIEETEAKTPDNAHGTNPTSGCAALALASIGAPAAGALAGMLSDEHWWVRAVAAHVLGRLGASAMEAEPALRKAMRDRHWWVRRNALEALSAIGVFSATLIADLTDALGDEDYRVRRNAALTLAKCGEAGCIALAALHEMLEDENRYNRFYAAHGLKQIDTPAARDILLRALFNSRWCSITTKDDLY
ncbi:MAG: HEAT repeat domain-containing protein [Candidatus Latescibacteria bacterium]|nr:HEAT repeat domain-containing protein [Candidatus Latescibacterota bacterium]